jgi:hypothetical protein
MTLYSCKFVYIFANICDCKYIICIQFVSLLYTLPTIYLQQNTCKNGSFVFIHYWFILKYVLRLVDFREDTT